MPAGNQSVTRAADDAGGGEGLLFLEAAMYGWTVAAGGDAAVLGLLALLVPKYAC